MTRAEVVGPSSSPLGRSRRGPAGLSLLAPRWWEMRRISSIHFTGEGIYSALSGAELLAATAVEALQVPGPITVERLAPYRWARFRAFVGKWMVERMIGYGMAFPALFDRAVARLGRREGMADTLIGVTGDFVPAREVLNPLFLARMIL